MSTSSSPSLLQSLKRFRFKKHGSKEENGYSDSGNTNSEHFSSNENSTDAKSQLSDSLKGVNNEFNDDDVPRIAQSNDTISDSEDDLDSKVNDNSLQRTETRISQESNDCDSQLVISRKNKRFVIDDTSENEKSVDSNSDDELVIIRKKKRLKRENRISSDASDKSDKKSQVSKTDVKAQVQKNITNYFIHNKSKSIENRFQNSNEIIDISDSSNSGDKVEVEIKGTVSLHRKSASSKDKADRGECSNNKKRKKKKKHDDDNSDSDDTVLEGYVYDSDADSDEEMEDNVTGMKARVLEFLNTASENELLEAKCSMKRSKSIVDARPFVGWRHLVQTCETNKSVGTDILNSTQDLLTARDKINSLLKRCKKISSRAEKAISAGAHDIVKQPLCLNESFQLKSYQMVGLNWLAVMHSQNISGILADEMGLGKTIQVIAFLAYLKEKGHDIPNCPHIIIVPGSTLENWCNEFEKWCPRMKIVQYYGTQDERREMRHYWVKHGFGDVEVILSTYQIVSGAYEEKKLFRVLGTHYAIFDEGHMLKNMNSQRYENLYGIKAKRKLLLTGTPIQNNLLELMSLLMFIMPSLFATKRASIKFLFERKHNVAIVDQVKFEKENIENVKRIMRPFMLRRLKTDVLKDLPKKTTDIVKCPMAESQAKKYKELLDQFKESASDPKLRAEISYMGMFTDLRRLANHPLTLRYLFDDDKISEIAKLLANDFNYKENDADKIFEDLEYKSDHELHKLSQKYKCLSSFSLPDEVFLDSGKFAKFDELLPELKAKNHRLLIFTQFVFVLDIMEEYLRIRDHTYLRFDGSTKVLERQQLVDLYNQDPQIFVFLLTTKAGGVGINLTAADTVIINDVDFNPYNDKQAEDRCHRMGQSRDVKIIRFICKDSIEETIFKVAQEKMNLGKEVTADDGETTEQKNVAALLHSVLGIADA